MYQQHKETKIDKELN